MCRQNTPVMYVAQNNIYKIGISCKQVKEKIIMTKGIINSLNLLSASHAGSDHALWNIFPMHLQQEKEPVSIQQCIIYFEIWAE